MSEVQVSQSSASVLAEQSLVLHRQARSILEKGKQLAEQSAREASRCGDVVGVLSAHTAIAGYFQASLGNHREAEDALRCLAAGAEALVDTTQDSVEKMRIFQVVLDAQLHHIDLLVSRGGSAIDISILLQKVEANPFYLVHKGENQWSSRAQKARAYLDQRRHVVAA